MNYLPATPILILDQFEEFFVHSQKEQAVFIQLLADIIFGRVPAESIGTAKEQQLATKLIEEGLIVDGARVSLAESIVTSRYNITDSLLGKLLATRLIKPENTHLGKAYEVSHDTLVAPILTSFKQRKLEEERLQRAQEKKEQEEKLAAQQAELEEEQRRCRQANRRTTIAVAFAVLALIASIAAFILWNRASAATQTANDAVKKREAQLKVSDSLRIVSDNARIEAERSLKAFHLEKVESFEARIRNFRSSDQFKAEKELHTELLTFTSKVLKNSTSTPEELQQMEMLEKQTAARIEELKDY